VCFCLFENSSYDCSFLINSSDDKLSREGCIFNLDCKISTNVLISSIVYIKYHFYNIEISQKCNKYI
jgi:hypothetical protein